MDRSEFERIQNKAKRQLDEKDPTASGSRTLARYEYYGRDETGRRTVVRI
jgi:hypothetical protein